MYTCVSMVKMEILEIDSWYGGCSLHIVPNYLTYLYVCQTILTYLPTTLSIYNNNNNNNSTVEEIPLRTGK